MILAQILAIVFILFALSRAILRFRSGQLGLRAILFWGSLWLLAILFLISPDQFGLITKTLGIGRGVDGVIYASLVVLFYLIFRNHVQIEELHIELTKLTRALALKDFKKRKDEDSAAH